MWPASNGSVPPRCGHGTSGGFRPIQSPVDLSRQNLWFPFGVGGLASPARLFCLPFAGGGASVFLPLRRMVDVVDIAPIQCPGHETRLDERCATDLRTLVADIADAVAPWLDRPYALLGTSMGAKLAFALAHRLIELGAPAPRLLMVAAHRPPDATPFKPGAATLPDADFRDHLRRYGGTPEAVLSDPEMSALLLPILRADFALAEQRTATAPLTCPIVAYAGKADETASPPLMREWARFTDTEFSLREFDGGHFFFRDVEKFGAAVGEDAGRAFALRARVPVQAGGGQA